MHKRDVSFAIGSTRTCAAELLLGLRDRKTIPVLRVNAVGNHPVAKSSHCGGYVAAGLEVRRTHVGGFDTNDVDQRCLKLLHFGGELSDTH